MLEDTHAPGWRGRPKQTGPILGMYDRAASRRRMLEQGDRLERAFAIGCGAGALLCLAAAAIVWAEPAAAWLGLL